MTVLTVYPGQSMTDVLGGVRVAAGTNLTVEIPADTSVLLTANEFRALALAAERQQVELSIFTEDPLRRQLALLFGIPVVNEIPEPLPFQPPAEEPPLTVLTGNRERALAPNGQFDAPAEPNGVETGSESSEIGRAAIRPKPQAGRSIRKVVGAILALGGAAAIALLGYWWFFSTTTVKIHLHNEPVSSTLTYSVVDPGVTTDNLNGIVITGQPVTFKLSLSLSAPATGTKTIPNQTAAGTLVLRNATGTPVTIDAGSEFESFEGTKFVFDKAVEVPAATENGKTPGETTAEIRSIEAGSAGNRDLGMLTGRLPNGIFYSNRMETVSGGTDKRITTISEEDVTDLREQVNQQLTALAATTALQGGLLIVPSSIELGEGSYEFDQKAGDEAAELKVNATVPFRATAYDPTALSDVAAPGLAALVESGYRFDRESVHVNTPAETGRSDGVISMIASVSGEAVPDLDDKTKDSIAGAIAGSSESEARSYLGQLAYINQFDIEYSPSWLPERIPDSAERIEIEIEQ